MRCLALRRALQVLTNFSIPFTFVIALKLLPQDKYNNREKVGVAIVCAALVLGMVPTPQSIAKGQNNTTGQESSDSWYWVLSFIVSVVFGSLQQIQQERAFEEPYNCTPATSLFWYNLLSLLAYIVTIPMEAVPYLNGSVTGTSLAAAFDNQAHAFRCYLNFPYPEDVTGANPPCHHDAWLWPTVFVVGYAGYFFFYALMIKHFNVVFAAVLGALIAPLSALVFLSPTIVGAGNTHSVSPWVGASLALAFIGMVIK